MIWRLLGTSLEAAVLARSRTVHCAVQGYISFILSSCFLVYLSISLCPAKIVALIHSLASLA